MKSEINYSQGQIKRNCAKNCEMKIIKTNKKYIILNSIYIVYYYLLCNYEFKNMNNYNMQLNYK